MHLKTYQWLALVLLLSIGMGCGSGTSNSGGVASGGDASLVGTWNLVNSGGGNFPPKIVINSNGTGLYLFTGGTTSSFTWSQSGSTVTISTGSLQAASINNLSSPVGNTFTLNSLGATATYNRA